MAISSYDATAANNTTLGGIDLSGTTGKVKDGDNVMRQMAADMKNGVITGYTTTATAAGTTTLTVASNSYQFFTGTTTQTVVMPVTSTLELGRVWAIVNNSTGSLTVNSSGSNLIITVAANTVAFVQCILLTGTTAASWDAKIVGFASSTGSGAVVRATSPTLVTPTLGVASATSITFGNEALSTYDEGTWTPALTFGGAAVGMTYTTQTGLYVKIGQLVFFDMLIVLSAKGSSTGNASIAGLPFTNQSGVQTGVSVSNYSGMASMTSPGAYVPSSDTTITPFNFGAASNTVLTHANFSGTAAFRVSGCYRAAA